MGTQKPRGRRRQMARRLRALRLQANMSVQEVADRMGWSSSKLSRWESGEQLTEQHALQSLLDIYGLTVNEWGEYLELSKLSRQRGWWWAYGLDNKGYVPLEADASLVKEFTLTVIPGLLQTTDYARVLFSVNNGQRPADRLQKDLAVRMIRQKRLIDPDDPLRLIAIMDESALYRLIGGPEVMKAQLTKLLEITELDAVTLQILPSSVSAHPSMDSGFTLLSFGDLGEPDVMYVEHALGATHSEKEAEVARGILKFDRLRSDALSAEGSTALIRRAAEQL